MKYFNNMTQEYVEMEEMCNSNGCDYCKGSNTNCRKNFTVKETIETKLSNLLQSKSYKLLDFKQYESYLFTVLCQSNIQSIVFTYNSDTNDIFWGNYFYRLKEAEKCYYSKILDRL